MAATQYNGLCSECGRFNPRTNLICSNCGARLPWADALEKSQLEQRVARAPVTAAGATGPSGPWYGSTHPATGGATNVSRYAAMQRSLIRAENVLLVLIVLVGWSPVAILHLTKAKMGTSQVCEVC